MSHEPVDLKLYQEAKGFLQNANDKAYDGTHARRSAGSYTYFSFPLAPKNDFDEVYPNILLGNRKIALEGKDLVSIGVKHVVNASMGPKLNQTDTNEDFYKEFDISFHGIPALDVITFKLFPYLRPAADFMDEALNSGGKVYVHCQQGVSRSATVVLAYLMLKKDLDLMTALRQIREKRNVYPNDGFLKQLCHLQKEIQGGKQEGCSEVK